MEEDTKRKDLTPGKRYHVRMHDCCIQGNLYGVFLRRITYHEDGCIYVDAYEFDFGTIGPDWGQWSTEKINDSKS